MNGGPIQVCPVCQYDLQSLPRNYRCPECGFEYEETMRVWFLDYPMIFKIMNCGFVPATGVIMLSVFLMSGVAKRYPFMLAAPAFMLVQPLLIIFFLRRKFQGFILTGRDGISFRYGFRRVSFRPWHEVRLGTSIWTADILTGSPSLPHYLPAQVLKSTERVEIRNEIILRLQNYYSGHAAPGSRNQQGNEAT